MKNLTAIMCALSEEFDAIKTVFQFDSLKQDDDHKNFWHATLDDRNYIIAVSHIGCINASVTASKLCIQYQPGNMIFCGIAGAISNKLKVGDVIIPDNAFYVESVSHESFADLWDAPNPDLALHSANLDMNLYCIDNNTVSQATVATSDVFPAPEKSLNACYDKNATIIDMETYPAAFVAKHFNVPFYCVRSVSNAIDTHEIPDNALSISAMNAAIVAKQMILQLGL